MKKKYLMKKINNNNDTITIKKNTLLKIISSVPISFIIYKFNEKLDLITTQLTNSKEEINLLKNEIILLKDKLYQVSTKVTEVTTNEIINIEPTNVSKILSFLGENSFNITLGVLTAVGIYLAGKVLIATITSTGVYRACQIVDETIGNIAEGTQSAAIAASQAGNELLTSAGESIGSTRSLFENTTINPNSIPSDRTIINQDSINNMLAPNTNIGTVEFPISNRIEFILEPEKIETLKVLEKDVFELIDSFYGI